MTFIGNFNTKHLRVAQTLKVFKYIDHCNLRTINAIMYIIVYIYGKENNSKNLFFVSN